MYRREVSLGFMAMKKYVLLLLALITLVSCGTRNNKRSNNQEEVVSPYGDWEICDYKNDFDEPTGEKFVRQVIRGSFSNSATASSPLWVVVFFTHDYNSYSGKHSVEGYMRFDEYIDGTEDFHIWNDCSPAKKGTKIIDKPNHKAYYYEERRAFRDIDTDKWYYWSDILRMTPSTYDFTVKGEYKDEYRFSINTDKLNLALKDAGLLEGVEDLPSE